MNTFVPPAALALACLALLAVAGCTGGPGLPDTGPGNADQPVITGKASPNSRTASVEIDTLGGAVVRGRCRRETDGATDCGPEVDIPDYEASW